MLLSTIGTYNLVALFFYNMIKNEIEKRIIINEHTSLPMEFFNNPLWTQKRKFSEYEAWMLLLVDANPIVENVFIDGRYNITVIGVISKYIGYYTKVLQWNKAEVNKFFKYLLGENAITIEQETKNSKLNITIHNYDKYVFLNLKSK